MSPDIAKVSPSVIRWKVSLDLRADVLNHDVWTGLDRVPVSATDKYRSVVARYVDGIGWGDTPLFQNIYKIRFACGEVRIRGCQSWPELRDQYHGEVDAMYRNMRAHGFRSDAPPIPVYLSHDGELLLGNNGNHRLAMAQLLNVPFVIVEIVGRHPAACPVDLEPVREIIEEPINLPQSAQAIPAMTTEEERRCYYQLARASAASGAVIEFGAWLGAATAYLAAGIRDAGVHAKVHTFDRFIWKPTAHDKKAGGPVASQLDAFKQHLGPLMEYVQVHCEDLDRFRWTGGPVALVVCDLPKRIPQISAVLSALTPSIQVGTVLAWQDFAYFPAYDIPAALSRLSDHLDWVDAVHPGTSAVFRVTRPWTLDDVSPEALALDRWTPDEIESTWDAYAERLPVKMRPRFACGAAMFLSDLGATDRARRRLQSTVETYGEAVLPKWRYLMSERPNLMQRYQTLTDGLVAC